MKRIQSQSYFAILQWQSSQSVSFVFPFLFVTNIYIGRDFFKAITNLRSYGVVKNFREEFFTVRKRSLGQGNIFAPVCHSVQGGTCPGTPHPQQVHPPGRYSPPAGTPPRQVHSTRRAGTPPCSNACWDMVNKRAVRILLECILVIFSFCTLGQSTLKPRSCRDRLSYNLISHFLLQI